MCMEKLCVIKSLDTTLNNLELVLLTQTYIHETKIAIFKISVGEIRIYRNSSR